MHNLNSTGLAERGVPGVHVHPLFFVDKGTKYTVILTFFMASKCRAPPDFSILSGPYNIQTGFCFYARLNFLFGIGH